MTAQKDRELRKAQYAAAAGRRAEPDARPAGKTAIRSKPVRITLDLGSELFHADERGEAWRYFHAATALARDLDDPDLLARVALTVYRCGTEGDDQTQ